MNDDQNEKEDNNWAKRLPKKKREQVERVLNIKLAAMQSRSLKLYFVTFNIVTTRFALKFVLFRIKCKILTLVNPALLALEERNLC